MNSKSRRGISFYPMEAGYTTNKKIQLLKEDCGPEGPWIWTCIIDYGYKTNGYFFSAIEKDEIILFARNVCNSSVAEVSKTIDCSVRRELFSPEIYHQTKILTSDRMQINYIRATHQRRRKGARIFFSEKLFVLSLHQLAESFKEKHLENIFLGGVPILSFSGIRSGGEKESLMGGGGMPLFPGIQEDFPGNNSKFPGKSENFPVASRENPENSRENPENSQLKISRAKSKYKDVTNTNVLVTAEAGEEKKIKGSKSKEKTVNNEVKGQEPAEKVGESGKKSRRPAEPFIFPLMQETIKFCHTHKLIVPSKSDTDFTHLRGILVELHRQSTDEKIDWTEEEAKFRLNRFLSAAATRDDWLKGNFLLSNLNSKKDKIFWLIKNPHENGKAYTRNPSNGSTDERGTSDKKMDALASWGLGVPGSDAGQKNK